jgi:outer membrane lipoprotein carrier protein
MIKYLTVLTICYSSFSIANNDFVDFFNSFETISANFNQQTIDENNSLLASTTGYFKFKRPMQFIWKTQQPIEQTLLLNNNQLWLVDHELEQASIRNIDELKNTPLYWLLNRPKQIKTLPTFELEAQNIRWYATQQNNQLSFGFSNGRLLAIQMNNQLNQTILVNFSDLKINPILDKNTFKLALSPDFDVIQ